MSTRADIIYLIYKATEESLEKILDAVKKILREEKGDKIYTIDEIKIKAILELDEEAPTLLMFDVVNLADKLSEDFLAEIERDGVILYEKI